MIAPRHPLARWADELEGRPPSAILAAVAARFPGRVGFATGFGPEGCVLVDIASRSGIALDVFTLDTGYLFPETYALWKRLEERYGITIRGIRAAALPPADGVPPWRTDPDACCQARKVAPLRAELRRFDAWVTAIRRDQTPDRAKARVVEWDDKFGLVKVNPLAAWTTRDVWRHLKEYDVPTNPLHDAGYASIGCAPCTTPVVPGEDERAGRWRGRAKTECGLHSRGTRGEAPAPPPPAAHHGESVPVAPRPALASRGGFVLWFTGLSGAGKSTLSAALRPALAAERPVEILDGDEVRTFLSAGLGFSRQDRDTNVRRIGYVARLLARNGTVVVTAAISPYASTRDEVRALVEREGIAFVEVHVSASLESLTARDPKGLYRRALAGEIPHFTGVSDPYEPPARPDVVVRTDAETVDESARRILDHLHARGLLGSAAEAAA